MIFWDHMPFVMCHLSSVCKVFTYSNFRKRCRDVTLFHPGIAQRYMFIIMADNNIEAECSEKTDAANTDSEIKLCESIPGASLKGRKPKDLTTTELIRWLKCRQGASLKGRKADLVERYCKHVLLIPRYSGKIMYTCIQYTDIPCLCLFLL